jgi:PAS domain S-box-containing protein
MMQALVVADDLSPLGEVERVLFGRGWEVARVGCAVTAEESLRRLEPDLVLVQEDSRGVGAAACLALRRSGLQRMPYVIGVAWGHDHAAIRRLTQAGVDDVIAAPCGSGEAETRVLIAEARIGAPAAPEDLADHVHTIDEIQRRLHVQQAFLEGLFESAPEGIVILDQEDRVVRINSEFTRVFGFTPAEAIGQRLNDLIVPEELRTEGTELDGGVRRGERVMVETVRRHRKGHLIDVSVLATPIEVNGPVGAVGIYRDITDKKQREAALRESEARYRALFDQSPVGVFLCDRDLRITHCNEYLTALVGARYEDIVGADLLRLRGSRLMPGLRRALRGNPAFYEGPYLAPTGKQLHVSVQYAPLRNEQGQVIGGIGVLEDISHRVTAERQRRAQAAEMERVNAALRERTLELESAMKARSRLYAAMNHELRTPISAIMLYQELLLAETLGPLSEEQRRALDHSHTAAGHLLDLIRDILIWGRSRLARWEYSRSRSRSRRSLPSSTRPSRRWRSGTDRI